MDANDYVIGNQRIWLALPTFRRWHNSFYARCPDPPLFVRGWPARLYRTMHLAATALWLCELSHQEKGNVSTSSKQVSVVCGLSFGRENCPAQKKYIHYHGMCRSGWQLRVWITLQIILDPLLKLCSAPFLLLEDTEASNSTIATLQRHTSAPKHHQQAIFNAKCSQYQQGSTRRTLFFFKLNSIHQCE